jgi:hypothetical protein
MSDKILNESRILKGWNCSWIGKGFGIELPKDRYSSVALELIHEELLQEKGSNPTLGSFLRTRR